MTAAPPGKEKDDGKRAEEFRRRVRTLNPDAWIVGEIWERVTTPSAADETSCG